MEEMGLVSSDIVDNILEKTKIEAAVKKAVTQSAVQSTTIGTTPGAVSIVPVEQPEVSPLEKRTEALKILIG